jgi:hypothetical protein
MKILNMRTVGGGAGPSGGVFLACVIGAVMFSGCWSTQPSTGALETRPVAVAPPWAPSYEDGRDVRYYYLPDYELYYDVWEHEFIYLEEGNWLFARELPGTYATIDLGNAFVVVLNNRIFEPWMHHQYYVAHYPRYYYQSVYNVRDARQVRGFNENGERTIRGSGEVRAQQHTPGAAQPLNQFPTLPVARAPIKPAAPQGPDVRKPGDERHPVPPVTTQPDKPLVPLPPQTGDHAAHPPRTPQPVHYYGDSVGKPVKVEPQMMQPKPKPKDKEKEKEKEKPKEKDR